MGHNGQVRNARNDKKIIPLIVIFIIVLKINAIYYLKIQYKFVGKRRTNDCRLNINEVSLGEKLPISSYFEDSIFLSWKISFCPFLIKQQIQ